MDHGIAMFVTDESLSPDDLGRLVEQHGFDSLFVPEHTHIPLSRKTEHPSGTMQEYYKRTLDPFVALTAAAVATTTLLVGTGVCLVPQHDPIVTAKEVATLDLISRGRFLFGVGAGWNVDELENHGTDPSTRFALMRERVLAMKAIWTQDEAEYHGRFVDFDPIWSWPKPATRPHPPILMGGLGPKAVDRVLDYADEWAPNVQPPEVLGPRIAELQRRAGELGRPPVPVTVFIRTPTHDVLEGLREIGVTRAVTWIDPCGHDEAEAALARIAAATATVGR
ncbi:MAG: LLM class F420-dependent oxidoreductase [Gaiellales bacterium]